MNRKSALTLASASVLVAAAVWMRADWRSVEPVQGAHASATSAPQLADTSRRLGASADPETAPPSVQSVPPPASGDGLPGEGRSRPRLAGSSFEASLLTDGLVNERAMKLLESKDFDRVVTQLDTQNAGLRNSVSEKYRAQVENTLATFDRPAQLDRFACGVNVCLASIVDREPGTWFNDWYDSIQTAATLPIGALTTFNIERPDGASEHRLLFTTHPDSAGFSVRPVQR